MNNACKHGGDSILTVGRVFEKLDQRDRIVNADVLDAWFPPAPSVLQAVSENLAWLLRTSPPAEPDGLTLSIANARCLPEETLLVGAGSSALIYLAFSRWLTPNSRVLLPDPTYGEYAHVLENVIGCRVDRFALDQENGYRLDMDLFITRMQQSEPYDLVVLVNPNNPAGSLSSRTDVELLIEGLPRQTRLWIDEAYINYAGDTETVEAAAARSTNVIVCKSLSKCYALSGARVAYLCGPPDTLEDLAKLCPPWRVSLPAQVAGVAALGAPEYYQARYAETALLREELAAQILRTSSPIEVTASSANWLLCRLPLLGPDAKTVVARCALLGVYVRDASSISPRLGSYSIRIAVKDLGANLKIVVALAAATA